MSKWEGLGLHGILVQQSGLRLKKRSSHGLVLEGEYVFDLQMEGHERITDTVGLRLEFPGSYPKEIPAVYETGDRIPKVADFHINPGKKNFCLGSRLRILDEISRNSSISSFLENCVDSFLYRIFHKLKYIDKDMPGGELLHGEEGLIEDYERIFGIRGKAAAILLLKALASRKRVANKLRCPCACGDRLGKCSFRFRVDDWRRKGKRRWYREHLRSDFLPTQSKMRVGRKRRRKSQHERKVTS